MAAYPSPLAYPSALASKVWHREDADSAPSLSSAIWAAGSAIQLADATIAESQSPARIAFTARCKAYMDDEQAVSTVRLETESVIFREIEAYGRRTLGLAN